MPWPSVNIEFISSFTSPFNTSSSSTVTSSTRSSPTSKNPSTSEIRKFAIFAASIHSEQRSYIYYAPIVAAAWQRIGYKVIVIFVGDFTNYHKNQTFSKQLKLCQSLLKRLKVHVIDFQCNISYSTKISQLVRIFGGFLSDKIIKDTDYIITTDSDIVPLHENNYILKNDTDGFIYNTFCCGSFKRRQKTYQMYPMCHICLSKQVWRNLFLESIQRNELLNSNLSSSNAILLSDKAPFSFDTISLYLRQEFGQLYDSNMAKGDSAWYMDQVFSSMLLNNYCEKHRNFTIDKRDRTRFRLDPGFSPHAWQLDKLKIYGDAHLIHDPIFDPYHYAMFKNLLIFLFNSSLANDFDFYYKQFVLTYYPHKPKTH
ncbi:unnamed protein product [Rotaria sp. Silwood2]|nr:unnamed protein product [Rotaria sp. Silwood2]